MAFIGRAEAARRQEERLAGILPAVGATLRSEALSVSARRYDARLRADKTFLMDYETGLREFLNGDPNSHDSADLLPMLGSLAHDDDHLRSYDRKGLATYLDAALIGNRIDRDRFTNDPRYRSFVVHANAKSALNKPGDYHQRDRTMVLGAWAYGIENPQTNPDPELGAFPEANIPAPSKAEIEAASKPARKGIDFAALFAEQEEERDEHADHSPEL